jgi:cytosine/uracil/thiamine/allantoin permease
MGPLAGIMVADYYLIKKRKLDIHALYQDGPDGIYWYTGGFNLRAFLAFGIAVVPLLPGFAKSIQPGLDVGGAWKIYSFAWLFGFAVALTSYLVINLYIWPQTVSLVGEAVLPPQKGEVSGEGEGNSETIEGKDVVSKVVSEKELDV